MKKNKLYILAFVFVALLFLIAGKRYLSKYFFSQKNYYQEKVSSFTKEKIMNIKIEKGKDTVNLVKRDNNWFSGEKKADSEKIESALETLLSPEDAEVAAETSLKHEEFGLGQDKATKITLNDELVIFLGNTGKTGSWAKIQDKDTVFSLPDTSLANLSADSNDWFDKRVVAINEENIQKLTFQKKDEKIVLVKKDKEWLFEEREDKIDQSLLSAIFLSLSSLSAKSVATDNDLSDYQSNPSLTLVIDFDDKQEKLSFREGEENYLLERGSDEEKFVLSNFQAEEFYISQEDL